MNTQNPFKPGDRVILSMGLRLGKLGQEALMRLKDGETYTVSATDGDFVILKGYEDYHGHGAIYWECFRPVE